MRKSTIYDILIAWILLLVPLSGMAQQNTDINKPTRSRVTNKDKKPAEKKAEQPAAKPAAKPAAEQKTAQPADKKAEQPSAKPAADKKGAQPVSKQEPGAAASPASDTASKAAPPKPAKPKKVPIDAEKAQFDGIDVSKHQGNIDWEELRKNKKIQFVYIKATEGSNLVDPMYKRNISNARKHGFKVGSYHFFTDLSSAQTQFQNFISTAKREEQDLIPVIDIEKCRNWSSQQLRDSVKVFADLIEDYYGCKPLIYTFETFFNKNLGKAFEKYPIFIAKYPKGQEQPNINGIKWMIWQFSETGRFKGVKDNLVDMSRFNTGYSLNDILYHPGRHKPKNASVRDAVDRKEKPATVNMTEQKAKEAPKQSKKQQEEAKKKAEADKRAKEKAKQKAEADKKAQEKAKQKAEQQKRQQARQQAHDAELKKEAEARAKREEARAKAKREADAKAKQEAEAKAKRKAEAQKARQQKASQSSKSSNAAALLNTSSAKLSQSQRNDSIRAARQQGRKTNKSSADND